MGQTNNYGLKQWESWERVTRGEVNGNFSAIDSQLKEVSGTAEEKCQMVYGTYTGDGSTNRKLSLPIQPKVVLLESKDGIRQHDRYQFLRGGLALSGSPVKYSDNENNALRISGSSFYVTQEDTYMLNETGQVYHYFALS